jgi:hypothetical protein
MSRRSKAKPGKTNPNTTRPKRSEPGDTASQTPAAAAAGELSDLEAMRYELARKLMLIVSDWRRCPRGACKRRRGCAETGLDCASPRRPERELTPDQEAAVMADFQRALKRRMAEIGRPR